MNSLPETKRLRNILLILTILAGMPTSTEAKLIAQVSSDLSSPEQLWVTLPSSPLEVRFSPSKRDIALLNRSSDTVARYSIGCVTQRETKTRVVRKMRFIDANLETGRVLINSLTLYANDAAQCRSKKGRLAVVEVVFMDESIWKAR